LHGATTKCDHGDVAPKTSKYRLYVISFSPGYVIYQISPKD